MKRADTVIYCGRCGSTQKHKRVPYIGSLSRDASIGFECRGCASFKLYVEVTRARSRGKFATAALRAVGVFHLQRWL